MKKLSEKQEAENYTDAEVNELAEWLEELTLKQCFFLKESFENYINMKQMHEADIHVH